MVNDLLSYLHHYVDADDVKIKFRKIQNFSFSGSEVPLTLKNLIDIKSRGYNGNHFTVTFKNLREIRVGDCIKLVNLLWFPVTKSYISACEFRHGDLSTLKAIYFNAPNKYEDVEPDEICLLIDFPRNGLRFLANKGGKQIELPVYNVFNATHFLIQRGYWLFGDQYFEEKIITDPSRASLLFQ